MTFSNFVGLALPYAPLLSAFGLFLGACAAWTTYFFYYRKTSRANWLDTFRKLYEEYWRSADMATMRKYIASEEEYKKIETVLTKRLSSEKNLMSSDENDMLELIDRFCALMIRILLFGERRMRENEKMLYDPLFNYWIKSVRSRDELMAYIKIYWTALYEQLQYK